MTDSTKRRRQLNHDDDSKETGRFGMDLFPAGHEEEEEEEEEEEDGYNNDQQSAGKE